MQNIGEVWEAVNKSETFEQLAMAIEEMADSNGEIKGRQGLMNAGKMAENCRNFTSLANPNVLTRKYGIRQQAMYIDYYTP